MNRAPDAAAPARLADLVSRLRGWLASEPSGADAVGLADVSALAARTPPTDPSAASRAEEALVAACFAGASGFEVGRASTGAAVRNSLRRLAAAQPGRLVEVRVPPWGAVQVGVPGVASVHRRGTPPNVVETDAATWLLLATGRLGWDEALATHRVAASGAHADLTSHLAPPG